jgi:hypothetical protein
MAALSASQAPGFLPAAHAVSQDQQQKAAVVPPPGPAIDGGSPYFTELPPLNTPTGPAAPAAPGGTPGSGATVTVPGGGASLPATVLDAYLRAQAAVANSDPGCHLPWQLLAAIGQVESGQARGGAVDANGTTYAPILGPVLDGVGFANISDTDGGAYDGDPVHDRAVGPMQFIPSTWQRWGADGNGDGARDPDNIYDAALAAAHYLCADGRDLAVPHDMDRAILGYNHSQQYLDLVKAWYEHFRRGGAIAVADRKGAPGPGVSPAPTVTGGSPSPSPSAPGATTGTPSPSGTVKPVPSTTVPVPATSPSATPTGSPTGSVTGTPTVTPAPSDTPTATATSPDCPTPTPSDSVTATPTPSDTPTTSPTPDPCATQTQTQMPSPSPSASETGAAVTGPAVTPTS